MIIACAAQNVDWLSLGTLIATLITAIVTYLTVVEVKKQREASYHPEIYLGNQKVFFYGHKWKNTYLPFSYSTEEISEFDDERWRRSVNIDLHNVGFAVAKAIEYEWKFETKKAVEKIQKMNKDGFFQLDFNKRLEISVPQIDFKFMNIVPNQLHKETINYILPSSVEKTPQKISVPSFYIDLYILFLSFTLDYYSEETVTKTEAKTIDVDFDDFPPLKLKLAYKDLHGKTHEKLFKLRFNFSHSSYPKNCKENRREYSIQTLIAKEVNE